MIRAVLMALGVEVSLLHAGIRDHVVQALELKYNCFFLMPVIDTFPTRLREEIEAAYVDNLDGVFDVGAVRDALNTRLHSLESELHQVGQTFEAEIWME